MRFNALWGSVKAQVYTDKPASIDALEDNIEAFIREILAEMLERVGQNWTQIMISCIFLNFMCVFLKTFPIAFKKSPYCYFCS